MPEIPDWMLQSDVMDEQEHQQPQMDEEEPIQVDAGYDDDCCNQIRQYVLQAWNKHNARWGGGITSMPNDKDGNPILDFEEYIERIPCEEVLETFGLWELFSEGETLQDVYNECAAGKMSHGDITTGEPMDMAWRLLKHV